MSRAPRTKAANGAAPAGAVERLAVLHDDGSVTVFRDGMTLEGAEQERRNMDAGERNLERLGIVAEVQIVVTKEYPKIATPMPKVCPTCQRTHE